MDQFKINIITEEVINEILKAENKHGNQDHLPSLRKVLINRGALRMFEEYEIPSEIRAKYLCQSAHEKGELTHADIVIEELSEAIGCMKDEKEMRGELIQLAAMVINWISAIDNNHKKK